MSATRGNLALVYTVRPGVPAAPGRARLLQGPRPVGVARAPRRRPHPARADELLVYGAFCLLSGGLLGWGLSHEDVLAERARRLEAQETAEVMAANSDFMACQIVSARQVVRGIPGFEPLEVMADLAEEQLEPDALDWCRGGE